MLEQETDSIKTDVGVGCNLEKPKVHASFDKKDPEMFEKALEFCKEQGIGSIFKKTVDSRSFSSNIRELIDQGVVVPDFIKLHTTRQLKITGRTKYVR